MTFNLRTGNFAKAGKAAADDAVRSQIAARKHSADFGEMAQQAQVLRSEVKRKGIEAATEVATAGIKATADVKTNRIKVDAEAQYKKDKRFAGVVSAAGQLTGKGLMGLKEEKMPLRDSSAEIAYYQDKENEYRDKANELRNKTYDDLSTTPSDTDNPGSSTAGKDASAGVTTTPATATTVATATNPSQDGWARISRVIRSGEGTLGDRGYTTQFTGTQFSDMSQHPRQIRSSGDLRSDAAGAYQFLSTTWDSAKNALNLPDFSRESQEKAGRYLAERRGDVNKIYTSKEEFKQAMDRLAPEWASLPYSQRSPGGYGMGSSYYGQGGISLDEAWNIYNQ